MMKLACFLGLVFISRWIFPCSSEVLTVFSETGFLSVICPYTKTRPVNTAVPRTIDIVVPLEGRKKGAGLCLASQGKKAKINAVNAELTMTIRKLMPYAPVTEES
jgi:hypothetical protein